MSQTVGDNVPEIARLTHLLIQTQRDRCLLCNTNARRYYFATEQTAA